MSYFVFVFMVGKKHRSSVGSGHRGSLNGSTTCDIAGYGSITLGGAGYGWWSHGSGGMVGQLAAELHNEKN